LIFGHTQPGAEVTFNGRKLRVSPQGEFVLGLDRDEKPDAELRVRRANGSEETQHYTVAAQQWQIQSIEGLPPAQVNPPPKVFARLKKEQALISAARDRDSELNGFTQAFVWPARGSSQAYSAASASSTARRSDRTTASMWLCPPARRSSRPPTASSASRRRICTTPAAR